MNITFIKLYFKNKNLYGVILITGIASLIEGLIFRKYINTGYSVTKLLLIKNILFVILFCIFCTKYFHRIFISGSIELRWTKLFKFYFDHIFKVILLMIPVKVVYAIVLINFYNITIPEIVFHEGLLPALIYQFFALLLLISGISVINNSFTSEKSIVKSLKLIMGKTGLQLIALIILYMAFIRLMSYYQTYVVYDSIKSLVINIFLPIVYIICFLFCITFISNRIKEDNDIQVERD